MFSLSYCFSFYFRSISCRHLAFSVKIPSHPPTIRRVVVAVVVVDRAEVGVGEVVTPLGSL